MNQPPTTLRHLFEAALMLAPGARSDYLRANCSDPAQIALVEQMLAADAAEEERLLDRPFNKLLERFGDIEAEAPAPPTGSCVGPFTLLDRLGEGGSSIVYRAVREH